MEEQIVNGVLVISSFLLIAMFSSMLLKKVSFPYTIGLVLVGGIVGFFSYHYAAFALFRNIDLSPGIILYIVLPTLIFEAAINIDFRLLRKNIVPILLLAVFGLLLSTAIIGICISQLTALPLMGALLFGALISATDPVAVIALFNEIGAPKRLVTLIDGESIFNDATAIVTFTIIMGIALHTTHTSVAGASWNFIVVLLGGVVFGGIVGAAGSFVNGFGKENLFLQITISLVTAYFSFVVADHFFHFSGVMSTLTAGLVIRASAEKVVKRKNLEILEHFWEYFSFVTNSIVFLLLGLTELHIFKDGTSLATGLPVAAITIGVVLVARFAGVYTLMPLYNLFNRDNGRRQIPLIYQHILFWGGLRGAVPVALVLAIPPDFPYRNLIVHFTFNFILFTLVFQGTTIKKLMDILGIRPETTDFGDRQVEHSVFHFDNAGLTQLVMHGLHNLFDDEGFFIKDKSSPDALEYVLKRGDVLFHVTQDAGNVVLISEPGNTDYFKTVLYESLLSLDKSVKNIESIIHPQKIKDLVAPADTKASPHGKKAGFSILRYLSPDRMLMNLTSGDKEGIIRELVQQIVQSGALPRKNFENVFSEVIEREKTMSTALGNSVAFPHAKSQYVTDNIVLIALAPNGIDFDAIDGKKVTVFVLIISPKNDAGPHLHILSSLSRMLSEDTIRSSLLESKHGGELYRKMKGYH